jgi:hypothetical protein
VFENRVLRRMFGPKRDEVTGEWRKLHNEELFDLYSSPSNTLNNQVEEDEMGGPCSTNGREEERVQVIGKKARGKETARKAKMQDGSWRDRMRWCGLDWSGPR